MGATGISEIHAALNLVQNDMKRVRRALNACECGECEVAEFSDFAADSFQKIAAHFGGMLRKIRELNVSVREKHEKKPHRVFAVDFDGTLAMGEYPKCENPNVELIDTLKRLRKDGDKVVLNTCRAGERLAAAVGFCEKHGLRFDAVNENLPEMILRYGGDTRKISADYYIDNDVMGADEFVKEFGHA